MGGGLPHHPEDKKRKATTGLRRKRTIVRICRRSFLLSGLYRQRRWGCTPCGCALTNAAAFFTAPFSSIILQLSIIFLSYWNLHPAVFRAIVIVLVSEYRHGITVSRFQSVWRIISSGTFCFFCPLAKRHSDMRLMERGAPLPPQFRDLQITGVRSFPLFRAFI